MTPAQRREARVALAMLPVGVTVMVVSALAFVAVVLFALVAPFLGGAWWWHEAWAVASAAIGVRNTLAGIAITAAFDWRPLPMVIVRSAAVVAGWLALP